MLSGGHLLIEDIPGVGKTLLAQVLARSVGGTFHRIQGTSDLLPGDVTGSMVPSGRLDVDSMVFRPGPVFANIVVFDELNRATPRTQSALLELAEEATVTVDGVVHPLPDPFMIVATQNPIDIAGTYGLGDGSLDRFRSVITPGRAPALAELDVLTGRRGRTVLDGVVPVATLDEFSAARDAVARVQISDAVGEYVVQLLQATREHPEIRVGASTRGGVAVVALARAFAAMSRRTFLTPDDIVRAAGPALAHRVAGTYVECRGGPGTGRRLPRRDRSANDLMQAPDRTASASDHSRFAAIRHRASTTGGVVAGGGNAARRMDHQCGNRSSHRCHGGDPPAGRRLRGRRVRGPRRMVAHPIRAHPINRDPVGRDGRRAPPCRGHH